MAIKHFAHITNTHLSVLVKRGNQLREEACFTDPVFARQGMAIYFARKNYPTVYVITDLIEEKFSLDTVPHLGYKDREDLLKRKCRQLYPKSRFVKYNYKGRLKTDKTKGRVQFSVINDEAIVSDWLDLLYDLKVPVAGLISLPVWTEQYAQKLTGDTHKLVVSLTGYEHGVTVRQSYFNGNILALSRVKYFNEKNDAELRSNIKEEIDLTRHFLTRQFSITDTNRLTGHLFFSDKVLLQQFNVDDFSVIDATLYHVSALALAKKIPLDEGSGLDQWLIHHCIPKGHYEDTASCFHFRHYQFKRGLNIAGLLILLSSLVYTVLTGNTLLSNAQAINHLITEQDTLAQSLQETVDPPLMHEFNALEMQAWLAEHHKVNQFSVKPDAFLIPISHVLASFKSFDLTGLSWKINEDAPDKSVAIDINAEINPFNGDYRSALSAIEQFGLALDAIAGIASVTPTTLPIELLTDKEMSGSANDLPTSVGFSLRLTWSLT